MKKKLLAILGFLFAAAVANAGTVTIIIPTTADQDAKLTSLLARVNAAEAVWSVVEGSAVGPSGDSYDLESSTSNLPRLAAGDQVIVAGFGNAGNNGLFDVDAVNAVDKDYTISRVDAGAVGAAEADILITAQHQFVDFDDYGKALFVETVKKLVRKENTDEALEISLAYKAANQATKDSVRSTLGLP